MNIMKTPARDERLTRKAATAATQSPLDSLRLLALGLGLLSAAGLLVLAGLGPAAGHVLRALATYLLVFLGLGLLGAAVLARRYARPRSDGKEDEWS